VSARRSLEQARVQEQVSRRNARADWRPVLYGTGRHLEEPLKVEGVTPLHIAAWNGSVRICEALLSVGARHGCVDVLLRSPLMLAGERGHSEVTTLLLESQAAIGANAEGHSAATLAARAGHAAILRLLLDCSVVDANFVSWAGGPTMLHLAAQFGRGGCVALLCEHQADVGAPLDPGGLCPLMLAADRGHPDICQELIARGAPMDEVDDEGRTAWVHAAAAGRYEVCHLLSGFGACEQVAPRQRTRATRFTAAQSAGALAAAAEAAGAPAPAAGRRVRVGRQAEEELSRPPVNSAALRPGAQPRGGPLAFGQGLGTGLAGSGGGGLGGGGRGGAYGGGGGDRAAGI